MARVEVDRGCGPGGAQRVQPPLLNPWKVFSVSFSMNVILMKIFLKFFFTQNFQTHLTFVHFTKKCYRLAKFGIQWNFRE